MKGEGLGVRGQGLNTCYRNGESGEGREEGRQVGGREGGREEGRQVGGKEGGREGGREEGRQVGGRETCIPASSETVMLCSLSTPNTYRVFQRFSVSCFVSRVSDITFTLGLHFRLTFRNFGVGV